MAGKSGLLSSIQLMHIWYSRFMRRCFSLIMADDGGYAVQQKLQTDDDNLWNILIIMVLYDPLCCTWWWLRNDKTITIAASECNFVIEEVADRVTDMRLN